MLLLLADIVDWILFTLSTTCFIKGNLGETLSSRTRILLFSRLPCFDANQYAQCRIGTQIRASLLGSRCNICSLRSFTHWIIATNRRSITLLYKHRIHPFQNFCHGPAETMKTFGRGKHKISLISKCSNHFPTKSKFFPVSLARKSLWDSPSKHSQSSQTEPEKHKKTSHDKIS